MNPHRFAFWVGLALLDLTMGGCRSKEGGEDIALALPAFQRLDVNADGRVQRGEYESLTAPSPSFDAVDSNANGFIAPEELLTSILHQDPLDQSLYGTRKDVAPLLPDVTQRAGRRALLRRLRDDVAHVRPDSSLPDDLRIDEALLEGVDSPAVHALFDELRAAWELAGMAFPLTSPSPPPSPPSPPAPGAPPPTSPRTTAVPG